MLFTPAMTRFILPLVLSAAALTAACTSSDQSLRIGDAPGPVTLSRESFDWSYTGGSATVSAPGSLVFPEVVAIKLDIQQSVDGHERTAPIATGSIEVVPGSACRVTQAATCTSDACLAEIELTGPGVCMLRVRSAATDGEPFAQCWYQARWEHDQADRQFIDEVFAMAENQWRSCQEEL